MEFDTFDFVGFDDSAVLCPTVMINGSGNSVSRRCGGKDVHDETFVVAVNGKVHSPTVFGTPVPIEDVLVALTVEVPVYITPKSVDAAGKRLLAGCQGTVGLGRISLRIIFGRYSFVVTVDVVLVCGKQSLYEEGRFDEVTAVIFLPEGFHFSGISIPPVWISTVEAVGFFEEGNYLFHTGETFGTGDVTTVNTGNQAMMPKPLPPEVTTF